uniref:Unannotated protein n=1 Tax=freshwater metagenome TaxID=449393 RepID=A0A6J6A3B3_9ZZZZ
MTDQRAATYQRVVADRGRRSNHRERTDHDAVSDRRTRAYNRRWMNNADGLPTVGDEPLGDLGAPGTNSNHESGAGKRPRIRADDFKPMRAATDPRRIDRLYQRLDAVAGGTSEFDHLQREASGPRYEQG